MVTVGSGVGEGTGVGVLVGGCVSVISGGAADGDGVCRDVQAASHNRRRRAALLFKIDLGLCDFPAFEIKTFFFCFTH
jgi:hypothetical protein